MNTHSTDALTWIKRIRFRHLEILLAIAKHGSLTAAAHALDMTQPAASQWLAEIESIVGAPLFIRGRRLQPTPFAAPVIRHAERVMGDSRRVVEEVASIRDGGFGHVRIGTMMSAATAIVPEAISQLRNAQSPIRIGLVEDVAVGLWSRFDRNELDIIICWLDERVLASDYPQEALFSETYSIVCGAQHPLMEKQAVSWQDAANYPWIMPPPGTALRIAIEATFTRKKIALPSIWLESASFTANQTIFNNTDCLGVLSTNFANYYQSMHLLSQLPLLLPEVRNVAEIGMVWKEESPGIALESVLNALRAANRQFK